MPSSAAGVAHVWPRVAALVVQPGVEFDHQQVFAYQPAAARELSLVLDDEPTMVFEAHSTDYQTREALQRARHATTGRSSRWDRS